MYYFKTILILVVSISVLATPALLAGTGIETDRKIRELKEAYQLTAEDAILHRLAKDVYDRDIYDLNDGELRNLVANASNFTAPAVVPSKS